VVFAYRDGSDTPPTIPTGQNWTTVFNATGSDTNSHVVVTKAATAAAEASGTFTNASMLAAIVLRGTRALAVGAGAAGGGSGTVLTFPAVSVVRPAPDAQSRVLGFAGHRSTDVSIQTPPSGMTNQAQLGNATCEAAVHATADTIGLWVEATANVGGTASGWRTHVLEVREAASPLLYDAGGPTVWARPFAKTLTLTEG
jgi:hypothetical protein